MISRVAVIALVATLLAIVLMTPTTAMAACRTNADCTTPGHTCQVTLDLWIYKFRDCKFTLCNVDTDCPGGTLCRTGTCQAPATSTPGPSPTPAPGTIAGEGRKCMPPDGSKPADWAVDANGKPLGACPQGTSCSPQGFCRKLQQ